MGCGSKSVCCLLILSVLWDDAMLLASLGKEILSEEVAKLPVAIHLGSKVILRKATLLWFCYCIKCHEDDPKRVFNKLLAIVSCKLTSCYC